VFFFASMIFLTVSAR